MTGELVLEQTPDGFRRWAAAYPPSLLQRKEPAGSGAMEWLQKRAEPSVAPTRIAIARPPQKKETIDV
jgi:hypothetical protein